MLVAKFNAMKMWQVHSKYELAECEWILKSNAFLNDCLIGTTRACAYADAWEFCKIWFDLLNPEIDQKWYHKLILIHVWFIVI